MGKETPSDRDLIINTVNRIAHGVDTDDWDAVRHALTDDVTTDYTSVHGGQPETHTAEHLISLWREGAIALDAIQHLVGTHVVTCNGDQAECRAAVQTTHVYDDGNPATPNQWVLAGYYRHTLKRDQQDWRVTAITFTIAWETGDRGVVERALNKARKAHSND